MWERVAFFTVLFCLAREAQSQQLTPADQSDIYNSCFRSCSRKQAAEPSNASIMNRFFLLDSYCSCTCARTVQGIDMKHAIAVANAEKQGRMREYMDENPYYRKFTDQNARVCSDAISVR